MLRTLGGRLTALATGITLAVSLLVCATLYLGIRYSLYREVDGFLAGEVMEFRAILSAAGNDLDDVQRRIRNELGSRQRGDLTFRLLDADGRVLLTSDASNALSDPWPIPQRPAGDLLFRTESGSTLAPQTRTGSQWVESNGLVRVVQATYLLDQVNASLSSFLEICGLALAAAALLAVAGGRLLATRSLQPVARMASAARKISVANLRQRIERTGSGDELDVLAATFNEMFERLDRQVARIRQFSADAAHELRTPLAALRGSAEVALSSERSTEELRAGIAESIEEYDRLARIAEDLLLLARADAGQEFVHFRRTRLDTAVADVADLFTPLAEERGISLTCSAAAEVWIDGDDGRIRQMVGNLIDNAIKYTSPGGRVNVDIAIADDVAELVVSDTGEGIPAEHLPHLFDRFYRADQARVRSGGTGLGLAICRTIVEAHRGRVVIESNRDGTVARVSIPTTI